MGENAKINPTMSQPGYPENPPPYASGQPHYPGHPPPPGPYGPPLIGAAVIPTVVPMVIGQQMSPKPTPLTCRSCNAQIVTRVEIRSTTRTHLFALLLCLFGCWPCVCIPYCMDSCNNAEHYCPNCNAYIGSYQSYPPANPPPYNMSPLHHGCVSPDGHTSPQGYPPPQPQQAPTAAYLTPAVGAAVMQTVAPTAASITPVGARSSSMVCKSCHNQIKTKVKPVSTAWTHWMFFFLCIFGCWPCACLPYCMSCCNNADHYCPDCNAFIGSYQRYSPSSDPTSTFAELLTE